MKTLLSLAVLCAGCGASTLNGVVVAASLPGEESPLLAGVEVCLDGEPESCVATADDGEFTLRGIPPEGDVAVTLTKEGHVPQLHVRGGSVFDKRVDTALTPFDVYTAFFAETEPAFALPEDDGIVWLNDATHQDGFTATIVAGEGNGPYFSNDGKSIDTSASTVEGDGLGFVFFHGVSAGDVELELRPGPEGPQRCEQDEGAWRGPRDDVVRVPVRAGFETYVITRCR